MTFPFFRGSLSGASRGLGGHPPGGLSRRITLLIVATCVLGLGACSSSNKGGGTAQVRALNLTTDLPSIDLYEGDNKNFSAVVTDAITGNVGFDANTYTLKVKSAGDPLSLFTGSYALAGDKHYTAVVYGRQTALNIVTLPEDEDNTQIGSGNARVRVLNATTDTGTLDVFVTANGASLTGATPLQSAITPGQLGGFREISAGAYQLRITGSLTTSTTTGGTKDVRIDTPITIPAGTFSTIVITAGGGVLVNATLVVQQGDKTTLRNTKARVRVAASVPSNGLVAVNVGGVDVSVNLRSPSLNSYVLVPGGTPTVTTKVNQGVVDANPRTLAAGSDYTLLVWLPAGATVPQVLQFADDNRLPGSSTATNLRMINGVGSSDSFSLYLDGVQVFYSVLAGTSSDYTSLGITGSQQLNVLSDQGGNAVFSDTASNTSVNLLTGNSVYTIFVLSGNATPTGNKSRDR
jgi:hypothetical protein